jgi:hypothetical protein
MQSIFPYKLFKKKIKILLSHFRKDTVPLGLIQSLRTTKIIRKKEPANYFFKAETNGSSLIVALLVEPWELEWAAISSPSPTFSTVLIHV